MPDRAEHKGAGHRKRLRQRFLASGLDGFLDYEVIELLLTLGTPRRDCKDAAKAALSRFKSFQGVLEAGADELQEVAGIGPVNCFGVRLAKAVAERYLAKKVIGKNAIRNSRELSDYLKSAIRDKTRECFLAIFLDTKNRVLAMETLFEGTLNQSSVYPREVIRAALQHRAAALIFAHNHPSGDPTPSAEDAAITQQLVLAGRVMGITVHEHLIMGDNRYFSFADSGRIARMNTEAGGHGSAPGVGETAAAKYGTAHGR
ncbi:MAG: DNA repair protein RadC [Desulfobacterales bacterium]|jgi:DNA repair protein RadC|nr:DNA repair protein RadC [Desulfobacterales bacterium]